MRRTWMALSAAASLAFCASPASAAMMLNVNWNSGCGATTCFNSQGRFTQSWSAGDFQGPVTIGQLLIDRGILGALDNQTFRLSFTLNGQEVGTWGHYNMGGIGGAELGFSGENFVWNPEDGDLVLVLQIDSSEQGGAGGFGGGFRAFASPTEDTPGETGGNEGGNDQGPEARSLEGAGLELITQAVVPEPATWALMIGGFGMAGAGLRRRRALTA